MHSERYTVASRVGDGHRLSWSGRQEEQASWRWYTLKEQQDVTQHGEGNLDQVPFQRWAKKERGWCSRVYPFQIDQEVPGETHIHCSAIELGMKAQDLGSKRLPSEGLVSCLQDSRGQIFLDIVRLEQRTFCLPKWWYHKSEGKLLADSGVERGTYALFYISSFFPPSLPITLYMFAWVCLSGGYPTKREPTPFSNPKSLPRHLPSSCPLEVPLKCTHCP